MKALITSALCLGLALGVFVLVRRVLDGILGASPRPLSARRGPPAVWNDEGVGQVLQKLTRFRLANGKEAVHGTLIAEFAAGNRNASLYVAFCPPFETLPTVEARIDDASFASVKVAQQLHNGVQLEVRLPETPEDPVTVSVELFATEPQSSEPHPPLAV